MLGYNSANAAQFGLDCRSLQSRVARGLFAVISFSTPTSRTEYSDHSSAKWAKPNKWQRDRQATLPPRFSDSLDAYLAEKKMMW